LLRIIKIQLQFTKESNKQGVTRKRTLELLIPLLSTKIIALKFKLNGKNSLELYHGEKFTI